MVRKLHLASTTAKVGAGRETRASTLMVALVALLRPDLRRQVVLVASALGLLQHLQAPSPSLQVKAEAALASLTKGGGLGRAEVHASGETAAPRQGARSGIHGTASSSLSGQQAGNFPSSRPTGVHLRA